jgi:hypothetical protein
VHHYPVLRPVVVQLQGQGLPRIDHNALDLETVGRR